MIIFRMKNYADARDCYRTALMISKVPVRDFGASLVVTLFSNISLCWLNLAKYNQAIIAANAALEIDPQHDKSIRVRGDAIRLCGFT